MSLHERLTALEAQVQRLSLALEGVGRGVAPIIARGYPTLEEALAHAQSSPTAIPSDCVQAWLDDRERLDWHVNKQGSLFPLPESRTALWADLRTFARTWTHFEHERTAKNGTSNGHARPKQETVWQLKQSLEAVNEELGRIEEKALYDGKNSATRETEQKLRARRKELRAKLAGLE